MEIEKSFYFENIHHERERGMEGDVEGVEDGEKGVGSIFRR